MSSELAIALTAALAASACALVGVFLVLRRMAMMADAISHAILPGLVAGYVLARGPNVFIGFLGAAGAGLLTVALVELLTRSRRVREDTAIGVVFPALFALGVLIVSLFFANVHLDTDAVLYGEITFVGLDTWQVGGWNLGPTALWTLGALTLANAAFLALFYKELKLSTFDPALAAALGFVPGVLHYALMGMVAVTTVGGFTAVGAILVIALIIIPPVTASLLTHRLPVIIGLSLGIGIGGALAGYGLAAAADLSISGMIAAVHGVLFGVTFLAAPRQGIIAQALRRRRQRAQFATEMLVVHLATHEGTEAQAAESRPEHLEQEIGWRARNVRDTIARAGDAGLIVEAEDSLELTPKGRSLAQDVARR